MAAIRRSVIVTRKILEARASVAKTPTRPTTPRQASTRPGAILNHTADFKRRGSEEHSTSLNGKRGGRWWPPSLRVTGSYQAAASSVRSWVRQLTRNELVLQARAIYIRISQEDGGRARYEEVVATSRDLWNSLRHAAAARKNTRRIRMGWEDPASRDPQQRINDIIVDVSV